MEEGNDLEQVKDKLDGGSTLTSLPSYELRVSRREQLKLKRLQSQNLVVFHSRKATKWQTEKQQKVSLVQNLSATEDRRKSKMMIPDRTESEEEIEYCLPPDQSPELLQPQCCDTDTNQKHLSRDKIIETLKQYYGKFDVNYTPTEFKQSYEEFQKNCSFRDVDRSRLRDYRIIMRKTPINSKIPLSQNVSFCDWINRTQILGEEILKEDPFTQCMDSRLYIELHSKTYDKANYVAFLGKFQVRVTVRNVDVAAPRVSRQEYIGQGGFGYIVKEKTNGKVSVKKRIFFSRFGEKYCSKRERIQDAVREYAYVKLAACYGYGSGLGNNINDDITCYQDCVVFGMGYCEPFSKSLQELKLKGLSQRDCVEKFKKEIKQNLLWMHNYHIAHRDVKPSNCMYNPALERYVLIDFGISQPVEQGYEQQSMTSYSGTEEFMTNELFAIRGSSNKRGKVNVYEADMYAYDLTMEQIFSIKQNKPQMKEEPEKKVIESPKERLQVQLERITEEHLSEIVRNLNLLQSKPNEVVDLLKQIVNYQHLDMVVTAWRHSNPNLSEELKRQLEKLTDFQAFIEARFQHQIEETELGERELEFRLRLYGLDDELKRDWQKYIKSLDPHRQSTRIKALNKMLEEEQKSFISYDSPEQIRLMSGFRVPPALSVKSFKSILRCREKQLHWMEKVIAYCSLIAAQRNTGESQIRENSYLQKLRDLFAQKQHTFGLHYRQFLRCFLHILDDVHIDKAVAPAYAYIKKHSEDPEPYFSYLLIRIRGFASACGIILNPSAACGFLRAEEQLRLAYQRINAPQSLVMYFCIFEYTSDPVEKERSARQGIKVFSAIWECPTIENWSTLDAWLSYIYGSFLAHIFEDAKAILHFEEVLKYFEMRDTLVSSRMAAAQKCLASILMRTGQYDKAIKLWLNVLKSFDMNWGSSSLISLNALYEASRLFYKKGHYEQALRRCNEMEHNISLVGTSKEYKKKQFEMLCLKGSILTDMNQMSKAEEVLNESEKEYWKILAEQPTYKERYRYLIPAALRFARVQMFIEAEQCVRQIEIQKIGGIEEQGQYHLTRLEISLLNNSPSNESELILRRVEDIYEKMGRRHFSMEIGMLLLQARLQQQKQQGDFGEGCCNRCIDLLKPIGKSPQLGEAYWLKAQAAMMQGNDHTEYSQLAQQIFIDQTSWLAKYCKEKGQKEGDRK